MYPTPADQTDTDCNEPPSLREYPIILLIWVGIAFIAFIHAIRSFVGMPTE